VRGVCVCAFTARLHYQVYTILCSCISAQIYGQEQEQGQEQAQEQGLIALKEYGFFLFLFLFFFFSKKELMEENEMELINSTL
jgi:hypothetical protein